MASQPALPTQWVGVSPRGRTLELVTIVFMSVACATVILRLIARLKTLGKLLTDDYICIAAQVFGFALMADIIVLAESCGIGWHFTELPQAQALKFFKVYLAGEIFYTCLIVLYKLAVLFLYRSIFRDVKIFNIASWTLIAIIIGWWISAIFATMFQCSPAEKTWNPFIPGTCFNQDAYVLGYSIVNLALDIIILILPLPLIWRLNLTTKKKLALTAMFLVGGVVCVCTILRLASSFPISYTDPTYGLYAVTLWSQIEPAMGIIAACLPTLRQFFFSSLRNRTKSGQYKSSRSQTESDAKSQTAVALTGWKTNDAYTEFGGSEVQTPHSASFGPELEGSSNFAGPFSSFHFLDIVKEGPGHRAAQQNDNAIVVKQEVSVTNHTKV